MVRQVEVKQLKVTNAGKSAGSPLKKKNPEGSQTQSKSSVFFSQFNVLSPSVYLSIIIPSNAVTDERKTTYARKRLHSSVSSYLGGRNWQANPKCMALLENCQKNYVCKTEKDPL